MTLASALAVLVAGLLIGATSIGGVLVVPAISRLDGIALPQAIAASALGFGLAAAVMLAINRKQQPEPISRSVLAGSLVGAAIGAGLVHMVSARALMLGVTAIVLFAGVRGLLSRKKHEGEALPLAPGVLLLIGVVVGVGSALTGTGGPVLLTPVLLLLRQPPLRVLATAQAVQVPVALAATVVHWRSGALDWTLGLWLGVFVFMGSLAGARLVRYLKPEALQRLVSLLLLAVGAWYATLAFG